MTSPFDEDIVRLKDAVNRYEQAVVQIESESVSVDQIREVLVAREWVHKTLHHYDSLQKSLVQRLKAILSGKPIYSRRSLWEQVKQLDGRLKAQSPMIQQVIKPSDWQGVLPTFNEPLPWYDRSNWIWRGIFNEPLPWHDRYDWIWRGISLVCFGISLVFLLDIFNRFSTGGLEFLNTLLILLSGGITFLSGGASLTNRGQESSEQVFNSFGIDQRWWDELRCLTAILALALLIMIWWFGLPVASECYTYQANPGLSCFITGNARSSSSNGQRASIAVREANYQRAIALDPENYDAHLNLAQLYEEDFSYDSALREYQAAKGVAKDDDLVSKAEIGAISVLLKDGKLDRADQRLQEKLKKADGQTERTYQLNDQEYQVLKELGLTYFRADDSILAEQLQKLLKQDQNQQTAAKLFQDSTTEASSRAAYWFREGLNRNGEDDQKQYEMRSYLAWVYMRQEDYSQAKSLLEPAIKSRGEESLAKCLLAQLLYESAQLEPNFIKASSQASGSSLEQAAEACLSASSSEIEPSATKDLKETVRRLWREFRQHQNREKSIQRKL